MTRGPAPSRRVHDDVVVALPWPRSSAGGKASRDLPRDLGVDDVAVMLWAHPELIDWPVKVHWLFSFSQGDGARGWPGPGRLWGIDDDGELLIVDACVCRDARRENPIGGFLSRSRTGASTVYHEDSTRLATPAGSTLEVPALNALWRDSLAGEKLFVSEHRQLLMRGGRATLPEADGLLPGWRGCRAIRRWATLYLDRIAPRFCGADYPRDVAAALERRRSRPSTPNYIAVFLAPRAAEPRLSPEGRVQLLRLHVGARPSRVRVRAIQLAPGGGSLIARGWGPTLTELAGVARPSRNNRRSRAASG